MTDIDLPDLVVSSISVPDLLDTGEAYNLTYRVANQGSAAVNSSYVTRAYLCTDAVGNNPVLIDDYTNQSALPAGQFFDRTVQLTAPLAVKKYWVLVQTDVRNDVAEILENNNLRVSTSPIDVEPAYYATVETGLAVATNGSPITLTGQAFWSGSIDPAAGVTVNIHVLVRGTDRIITVVTDTNGYFVTTFTPLAGEAGAFTIIAAHPGEATPTDNGAGNTASLTMLGMKLDMPNAYQLLTEHQSFTVRWPFTISLMRP